MATGCSGAPRAAVIFVWVLSILACQPAHRSAEPTPAPGAGALEPGVLFGAEANTAPSFPPPEHDAAHGEPPEALSVLIDRLTPPERVKAAVKAAPKALNVLSASGAPERTQKGDLERFRALQDSSLLPELPRDMAMEIRFDDAVVSKDKVGQPVKDIGKVLSVWPTIEGEWIWAAPDTMALKTTQKLYPGDVYQAQLVRHALHPIGKRLVEDFKWSFKAKDDRVWLGNKVLSEEVDPDKPRLIGHWPTFYSEILDGQHVKLIFDQPVDPQEMARFVDVLHIRPEEAPTSEPEFKFVESHLQVSKEHVLYGHDFGAGHVLEVVHGAPLVPGQRFQVVLSKELQHLYEFDVVRWMDFARGEPLALHDALCMIHSTGDHQTSVPCDQTTAAVSANMRIRFNFSNEVDEQELLKHLKISPQPESIYVDSWWSDRTDVQMVLKPGLRYQATLSGNLKDIHGQRLGKPWSASFEAADLQPSMSLETRQGSFELGRAAHLPLNVRNVPSVDVEVVALKPHEIMGWFMEFADHARFKALESDWKRVKSRAVRRSIETKVPKNQLVDLRLPLKDVLPQGPVVALLKVGADVSWGVDSKERFAPSELGMVQVTDLGISTRQGADGLLVWVTRLSNGEPVEGAQVTLWSDRGAELSKTQTDAHGVTRIRQDISTWSQRLGLTATLAEDTAATFISHQNSRTLPSARPLQNPSSDSGLRAQLWTERGVYRPGEQAFVKFFVRRFTQTGLEMAAERQLQLECFDPRGKSALLLDADVDEYGGGQLALDIPNAGSIGSWGCVARGGSSVETIGAVRFMVEAYRVPRFEVEIDADEGGQTATIAGRYLFGAPMAGTSVQWSLERRYAYWHPEGTEGFRFGDNRSWKSQRLASARAELDSDGRLPVTLTLDDKQMAQAGPWAYMLEAEVQDVDRQTIASRRQWVVHDRDAYLGLNTQTRLRPGGERVDVEVIGVDLEGERVRGMRAEVSLVRLDWHTVERRGPGGSYHATSERVEEVEKTCRVRTAARPSKCSFAPRKTGEYRVVVEGKDRQGRALRTTERFYVYGPGEALWRRDQVTQDGKPEPVLGLVADQSSYAPGETAKVLVKSPWPQSWALVTVEREGVLSEGVVHLNGSAQIVEVPIEDTMLPNVYVHVQVVRGRRGDKRDAQGRDRMAPAAQRGRVMLHVRPDEQRLSVDVALETLSVAPGVQVPVEITVQDHEQNPTRASVAFWVVDEAVLQLTTYDVPDLVDRFYSTQSLRVVGLDSREDLVTAQNPWPRQGRFGGDGADDEVQDAESDRVRRNFKTTAIFLGHLETDDKGKARVSVQMPDNLTRFRFMAVAADKKSRFGQGVERLEVRRALMIRPALPRFAHQGDKFELGATVFNATEQDLKARVSLEAQMLSVEGDGHFEVDVPAGKNVEVRVPAHAKWLDTARVNFAVEAIADKVRYTDRAEVELEVKPPGQWRRAYMDGHARGALALPLSFPASARPDGGEMTVRLSSSLLVGLSEPLRQLMEYPYGCVEQTTSRTFPLLVMEDLLPRMGMSVPKHKLRTMAQAGVDRLASMVTPSGGLAYWPGGKDPHPYGTAYAMMALLRAKEAGLVLPSSLLDGMANYLQGQLSNERLEGQWGPLAFGTNRALTLYVLARAGRPEHAIAEAVVAQREALTTDALGFVLMALHAQQAPASLVDPVVETLSGRFEVSQSRVMFKDSSDGAMTTIFHSSVRPLAVSLDALSRVRPEHHLVGRLAVELMARRTDGHWLSTHGNLWALSAVASYARHVEGQVRDSTFTVRLGQEVLPQSFIERTGPATLLLRLPMDMLLKGRPERLQVSASDPKQSFFYTAQVHYLRRVERADLEPANHGVGVYRFYEDLQGQELGQEVKAGDVVRVRLYVDVAKTLEYVALDDVLPAGFEPINTRLASAGSYPTANGARATSRGLYDGSWAFHHTEQRDDRVLFFANRLRPGLYELSYLARATTLGEFTAPPALMQAMYDADVWGRSRIHRVVIR